MSVIKTILASAIALSSVTSAYAGGLNAAESEPDVVVALPTPPEFGSMGGATVPLVILGAVLVAAAVGGGSDDESTSSTTSTTPQAPQQ